MPNDVYNCLSIVSGDAATCQQLWQLCRGTRQEQREPEWLGHGPATTGAHA